MDEPSTTIKSPVIAPHRPQPVRPCEDIPIDVIRQAGLAFTPPEHEDGLRCHYDAANYQMAIEPIIWRSYEQSLSADSVETTIDGHRAAWLWVMKPTDWDNKWWFSCMVMFKTSYGVIQQSLFFSPIYSGSQRRLPGREHDAGPTARPLLQVLTSDHHFRAAHRVATSDRGAAVQRPGLARLLGLPAPTTEYAVNRGLRVPMRDGVELLADHYAPADGTEVAGTLLVRGPYGRGFPFSTLYARPYATRGYHVVVQSVRGTFGSGGVFEPMAHEVADGADTVKWLRQQSWFTGRFATIGPSYLGFTQWALLVDPPPELAAAVIAVGPHDLSASVWGTGAFKLTDSLGWADLVANQEQGRLLSTLRWAGGARRRLARATLGLPLGESARSLLGTGAQWYEAWLEHHDLDDPFWAPYRLGAALDRVSIPVLLISGWQDLFLEQTLEQYRHLRDRGVDVALTVGKWTHAQVTSTGAERVTRESLEWLDRNLAGNTAGRRGPGAHLCHRRRLGRAACLAAINVAASTSPAAGRGVDGRCAARRCPPVELHL